MRSATGAIGGISVDGAVASLSQEVLKVKEHHSQLCFSQSTYQGCTTQGGATPKKCYFSSDVEVTQHGRGADRDRAGDLCGFWSSQCSQPQTS